MGIPKFMEQIKLRRLAARRRLVGAFRLVIFLRSEWAMIRQRRRERLARTLRLATFLHIRIHPWIAVAKQRVAKRRQEEEQRRLEEEQRRQELENMEIERQQLEEHKRR